MVSEKRTVSCISNYNLITDNEAPGGLACMDPGALLAGFKKMATNRCYTQNMKALGLVVSKKNIVFFMFFPIVILWELSVAMETTILTQSAQKPNTINLQTQLWFTLKFD